MRGKESYLATLLDIWCGPGASYFVGFLLTRLFLRIRWVSEGHPLVEARPYVDFFIHKLDVVLVAGWLGRDTLHCPHRRMRGACW